MKPWRRTKKAKTPTAAQLERKRSEGLLKIARGVERDLHEIRRENHFAEALRKLIEDGQ